MQLNAVKYLIALDEERHFARAARKCNVSQPSLSAGLAMLEQHLGRRLVERDRRFIGLTEEGRAVLPWARQVVAALASMTKVVDMAGGSLRGELRLGVIPAAIPALGMLASVLGRTCPDVDLAITSLTSREIARRLDDFSLDAGVTYVEHEPPSNVVSVTLYRESAMFVVRQPPEGAEVADGAGIAWADALARPLCLLHQGMQNRRILDANLARRGIAARPRTTADSYTALLALVHSGGMATIMPDSYAPLLPPWARMIPFSDPVPPSAIGMVVPDRTPLSPLAAAAIHVGTAIRGHHDSL